MHFTLAIKENFEYGQTSIHVRNEDTWFSNVYNKMAPLQINIHMFRFAKNFLPIYLLLEQRKVI